MKHHYFIPVLIAFFLNSCVVVVDSTSSHFQDELYYSANEYAEEDDLDTDEILKWTESTNFIGPSIFLLSLYLFQEFFIHRVTNVII